MKNKLGERIISIILSVNLVFNNLAPFVSLSIVKAQDVTPPPAEETITPTPDESTPTPTVEVSPTQDVTPTEAVSVTPTVEVTPIEETSPAVEPTLEPTEAPSVPSPPSGAEAESNSVETSAEATSPAPGMDVQTSPTPEPLMTPNGHVDTTVVESYSCRADSLNGCLATDKADYAPTEVVVITGYGFAPNTQYTLRIYSSDEPAVDVSYQITTDENGSFTYSYQLDGTYRPNYTVELYDSSGFIVATTTFLDHSGMEVKINNDDATTNSLNVTLNISWTGSTDPTQARYANDTTTGNNCSNLGTGSWTAWEAISDLGGNTATKSWVLEVGSDDTRKVCVETKHGSETKADSDTILYSTPSSVQTVIGSCVQDAVDFGLNCTANDVSIANVTDVNILDDGCQFPGDTVSFTATWNVQSTATERYNIGLYFAGEGQSSALTGSCSVSTLANSPVPPNYNFDGNACGDISSAAPVNPVITMTVQCEDPDGDNFLNLPYCTSWAQNDNTACSVPSEAVPGSPSKCNCQDGFEVPITVPFEANIEVVKDLNPGSDPGRFNLQVNGSDEASCVGDTGTTGQVTVGAGTSANPGATHTVGETACTDPSTNLSDYATSISCVDRGLTTFDGGAALTQSGAGPLNVDVDEDDDIVCTVLNTVNSGHIIVDKVTDPSGSNQSFDFVTSGSGYANFSLTDSATPNNQEVTPGAYSVSETVPTGWDLTSATCDQGETPESIDVGAGETVTCTFTNTQRGSISGHKYEDGTQNPLQGWVIELWKWITDAFVDTGESDTTDSNGFFSFENLLPGIYQLREQLLGGWTKIFPTGDGIEVDLSPGEESTDNDFVNFENATIIVHKNVVKPDGTTEVSDSTTFTALLNDGDPKTVAEGTNATYDELTPGTYTVTEDTLPTGYALVSITDDDASTPDGQVAVTSGNTNNVYITNRQLTANLTLIKHLPNDNGGTAVEDNFNVYIDGVETAWGSHDVDPDSYVVSEDTLIGYSASSWSNDCDAQGNVTLGPGESKTCEITNDDQTGRLIVVKVLTNDDGGNATKDDFSYKVNDGSSVFFESDGQNESLVDSGNYTIVEDSETGYVTTYDNCDNIFVPNGGSVTCTITNDDIAPTVTLIKEVINDDGGNAQVDDFILSLGNNSVTSGVATTVESNTAYEVDEAGSFGYQFVFITGDPECPDVLAGNVTADEGENITCTITNDDIAPTLKLVKEVVTDNGGSAIADDWTLTADADAPDDDRNFSNLGGSGSFETIYANVSYDLSESTVSGYSEGSWNCDGGNLVDSTVTLGLNEDVTCTITNDDQTGRLVVVKVLINDNGGDLNNEDFSYTVDDGPSVFFEADGQNEETVDSGDYTIIEDDAPGYETTYDNCDDIFVPNGGSATCTITNNDIAPTLKLVKDVTNDDGGDAVASNWTLRARKLCAVGDTNPDCGFSDTGDSIEFHPLLAGTVYTLFESGPTGYAAGSWNCDDGILNGNKLTLGLDEEVTCTITNDDIAPTLRLVKVVEGGSSTPGDWTLRARTLCAFGNTDPACGFSDSGDSTDFHPLDAGKSYRLLESGPSDYTAGNWSCDNTGVQGNVIVLDLDQETTCTITNTRDTGTIIVHKIIDADGDLGTETDQTQRESWQFDVDGWSGDTTDAPADTTGSNGLVTFSSLNTGEYTAIETTQDGYDLVEAICDNESGDFDGSDSIDGLEVEKDSTTTCTFYNSPNGAIHGQKWSDLDGNGARDEGEDFLGGWRIFIDENDNQTWDDGEKSMFTDSGDELGWYWFEHLFPGTYSVCEESQDGWTQTSSPACHTVELPNGPNTCIPSREINSTDGGGIRCDFGNQEQADVTVVKYQDDNGNGQFDQDESTLEGWDISLGSLNETTNVDGEALFEDITPGGYELSETLKPGYIQTEISCLDGELTGENNSLRFEVGAGEEITCYIGNQPVNPELQISKSNDASGDKSLGDTVIYTITVKALDSQVLGVVLKDLLPNGFSFQNVISIIKNGSIDLTAIVGDPHYASPGTYNLGDMDADDVIVIKYSAKVSSVDPGLYKDMAYAYGKDVLDNRVLALAQPEGFVTTNFVGSSVNVNANLTQGGNFEIGGEVLGASTSLPATGGNVIWVILASVLSILGLIFMGLGLILKRKRFLVKKALFGLILALSLLFYPVKAEAAAGDLIIRLEQPKSPTSNNNFNITFTVMDLSESPAAITVKCFKKGPSDGGYSQFGSDIAVSAGGNSGDCTGVSNFVNTNGTYQFYATASNGSETATSETEGIISVGYNTQGDPTPPSNYKKEKISSCQYKITFKTADDGLTSRVEVYRSDSTSFNLDGSTRVGDITIGPNTDGSFTESVPDCNKTYYYVIRSFNSAGNPSGPVGDSAVTVTTSTMTTEGGAIPVEGVTLPGGGTGGGEVLGEEGEEATPTAKPEVIETNKAKGAVLGVVDFVTKKKKLTLLILAGVAVLGYGIYYFIKKRKQTV